MKIAKREETDTMKLNNTAGDTGDNVMGYGFGEKSRDAMHSPSRSDTLPNPSYKISKSPSKIVRCTCRVYSADMKKKNSCSADLIITSRTLKPNVRATNSTLKECIATVFSLIQSMNGGKDKAGSTSVK